MHGIWHKGHDEAGRGAGWTLGDDDLPHGFETLEQAFEFLALAGPKFETRPLPDDLAARVAAAKAANAERAAAESALERAGLELTDERLPDAPPEAVDGDSPPWTEEQQAAWDALSPEEQAAIRAKNLAEAGSDQPRAPKKKGKAK
jgi:hypothetical protein